MADPLIPPKRLDLAAANGLHGTMMACRDGDVTLDMAQVSLIGALCAQTLVAGARAACAGGHRLSLINVNDKVLSQLRAMGMTPETIMEGL